MSSHGGWPARRSRFDLGVIEDARSRQRRWRRRIGVATAIGAAAVAALLPPVLGGGHPVGGSSRPRQFAATRAQRGFAAGRASWSFDLKEPAGVVMLARVSSPRGVRALVSATIPGVAGVRFGTRRNPGPLSLSCRVHDGTSVCTQAVEWCPMPKARWRLRVTKLAGPPGEIRVDFVVAPRPAASAS